MPIYEYRCSSCGSEHEALQKLSEPLLVTCPHCHGDTLVKQVSAAGFQLKGSGWYVTDFRNGSKPAAAAPAKGDAPAEAGTAPTSDAPAKSITAKSDVASAAAAPAPAPAPAPKPSSSTD